VSLGAALGFAAVVLGMLGAPGALTACNKGAGPSVATMAGVENVEAVQTPMDPREAKAWSRAQSGADEDRLRLAELVGCESLRERAQGAAQRSTAIRAMSFCGDFSELPWLASIAASGRDDEAAEALDAIADQAARPRRPTDPEDAQELAAGCQSLLDLSRSTGQPQSRRVMAVRALRMLSERGCVKRADIPSDLDAKN
jgi:hypothetical protein